MKNQENINNKFNGYVEPDGLDVEYSEELADQNDIKAQERSAAADARVKRKL